MLQLAPNSHHYLALSVVWKQEIVIMEFNQWCPTQLDCLGISLSLRLHEFRDRATLCDVILTPWSYNLAILLHELGVAFLWQFRPHLFDMSKSPNVITCHFGPVWVPGGEAGTGVMASLSYAFSLCLPCFEMTARVCLWITCHPCLGHQEKEPHISYSMSLTWTSHIANTMLMTLMGR